MVTMVTSPGSNVTCLNCEIVEFWGIEQRRKSFFIYIKFDNIHINLVIGCLKLSMKLNKILAIMLHFNLDFKMRGQCTPPTYLKWEQFALFAWTSKFLCSMWLCSVIYETSDLPGAKHLFFRQWNNGCHGYPWNNNSFATANIYQ